MTRYDVHSHFVFGLADGAIVERIIAQERFAGSMPETDWSPERAMAFMDQRGIEVQLLSSPTALDADAARGANDFGAQVVAAHPTRFGLLAALPMADPDAALAEVRRAGDDLGADGFVLVSNYAGAYLGDPRFEPVLAELDRRAATIFVHPVGPRPFDELCLGRPGPLLEFPMDTARSVVDALFAGVLLRHRDLRLVLAHGGGALPALSHRIEAIGGKSWVANPHRITPAQLREQMELLYFDTAIAGDAAALQPALTVAGPGHLVFGTDFPPAGVDLIDDARASLTGGELLSVEDVEGMDRTFRELFARTAARIAR